jgi:hypothetical protein
MATGIINGAKDQFESLQSMQNSPMDGINSIATPTPAPPPIPTPSLTTGTSGTAQVQNPTAWNITPDQTVESRINSILNPNNPIIAQARAKSMQDSNERGLMNSSIAQTAADSAAYQAAIPIAQADASVAAKAAGYNADQSNQFASRNADSENTFRLTKINNDAQTAIRKMDIDAQTQASALQRQHDKLIATNSSAANAFSTAMSAINNIQNNSAMDGNTKSAAIAEIWKNTETQLDVLGAVAGLNLTSQLNFAGYPGFDAQGNYIGASASPAPSPQTAPVAPAPEPSSFDFNLR